MADFMNEGGRRITRHEDLRASVATIFAVQVAPALRGAPVPGLRCVERLAHLAHEDVGGERLLQEGDLGFGDAFPDDVVIRVAGDEEHLSRIVAP